MKARYLALLVTGACATANTSQAPQSSTIATTEKGAIESYGQKPSESFDVAAPPGQVFDALASAYAELGVETKLMNSTTGEIGNRNFEKMHRLGKVALSEYFGCGESLTGLAADDYNLTISIVSQVVPSGPGSRVRTTAQARAQNMTSSNGAVACASRGLFERRLGELVTARLSK